MGLDLYALEKRESFLDKELAKKKKEAKDHEKRWEQHFNFVEKLCQEQNNMTLDEFYQEHNGSKSDLLIDEFYNQEAIINNKKELLLKDEYEGRTNCPILNYYFDNCNDYYWGDETLVLDRSLLKNENNHEWIPYGPHHSSEDQGSVKDLLDEYQLLYPDQVPEAIKRIKSRKSIDEKDLRMIAFLEAYSDCVFAFL